MKELTELSKEGSVAVFHSAQVYPEVAASHNVVYVKLGSSAADDRVLADLLGGGCLVDSEARKLSLDGEEYDIVGVSRIWPEYSGAAARTGGIVAGDVVIDRDTVFENGMVICGALTVEPGVTLALKKGNPVIAQSARIGGHLLYCAPDFGFKPGHVVGPDAKLDPEVVTVNGHAEFFSPNARISGTGVVFTANSADVQQDVSFTGMISADQLTVRDGVTLTTKDGCWLNWIHGVLEDGVTFRVSETEICVLEYVHHDGGGGYYNHTGFGTTKVGQGVRMLGDNSFCWFWMGDLDGRFADVRDGVFLKAKQLIQANEGDLANWETSPVTGSGTKEDPYTMTFHEKDPDYAYVTGRSIAMDAAVNNAVQDRFPDCVLFDYWGKKVLGFRDLRAGNILIHKMDDLNTLLYFADVVVYAKQI